MLLVGLTGGLGAGKTTVAGMLRARGAVVVDADGLAREALAPGSPGHRKVLEIFGDGILSPSGEIDRERLAGIVFADREKRRALESVTHPEVFRLLAETVERHRDTDRIVVFDAPLIIETGFHEACDVLVVVSAPEEQQVERAARGRGMAEEEARERMAAQLSPEEREAAADVVVRNDGDLRSLEREAGRLWDELVRRERGR